MATEKPRTALRCAKCKKTIRKGQAATALSFCTYAGRRDEGLVMEPWLVIIAHLDCTGSLTPEAIREARALRLRVVNASPVEKERDAGTREVRPR